MTQIFSLALRALGVFALWIAAAFACRQLYVGSGLDASDAEEYATPKVGRTSPCEDVRRQLGSRVSAPASMPGAHAQCIES